MCNVRLKFKGLSQILGSDNLVLAVLVDVAEQRQLVIPCDRHQAYQIRLRMDPNMLKERNDLLPEVLAELMPFSFLLTYRFEIYALHEGKYMSCLRNTETGEKKNIRCTDGILLSLITGMEIYADRGLMTKQSAEYNPNFTQMAVPVNVITDKMLEESLRKAIENENYELASSLRDELKKRHPKGDKPKQTNDRLMKETRFFYVPDAATETEMPMDEALHALRVLRIKSGDEMFLMDGVGNFYRAEVTLAATKRCMYEVKEVMPQQPAWRGHVHLAIAPTKMMDRIEWMAEKATEVGFNELSFLNSQFSERKVMRTVRLDKIIVSAVKQSHKAWKPIVNQMVNFRDFINTPRKGRKFICHCYEEIEKKDLFTELTKACPDEDADVTVLIGPEGDFSIDEVRMAVKAGYESVTLGTSRLRTETAGLVAVTMANLARRL